MTALSTAPLDGITVIALEHAIAAPLCTRQLAELGARVIKIERPVSGDFARHYDDRVRGLSSHFVWTNRSKESLTLDLKAPLASEVLTALLGKADVFVQNLAPGAAARRGLDYSTLSVRFPQLIVCDISGYGAEGPHRERKAYDLLIQAEAGLLGITGSEEQAKSGISIADIAAATQAHAAILAALIQRGKTGTGGHIQISMLEAMVEWMGYPLYYAHAGASQPARTGADHATIYPYGKFSVGSGDEAILLGVQNQREWVAFCSCVLGDETLINEPRYATNTLRSEHRDTLRDLIESAFRGRCCREILDALEQQGIACAEAKSVAQVWQHPQLRALERFVDIATPNGPVEALLPPAQHNNFDPTLGAVPALGEHTLSLLKEFGFSDERVETLRRERAI